MNTIKIQGDNNNHRVLVYALSTCGWCNKTKKLLKDNKIAFEFVDVDLCDEEDFKTIKMTFQIVELD